MKATILTISLLNLATCLLAQTPRWSRDYKVEMPYYISTPPILSSYNDTIEVIGRKKTSYGQGLAVVHYNLNGDTLSTIVYGKDSVSNSIVIDYEFDALKNVYILQKEKLAYYKSKIVLQKYAKDGSLLWIEQIQDIADTSYTPRALALVNDTCLFITAHKEYNYPNFPSDVSFTKNLPYLYAYNAEGRKLWEREFDVTTEISNFLYDIFVHSNTAFFFVRPGTAYRMVKVDINNAMTVINNVNIAATNGLNVIQLTPDGNLLLPADFAYYKITKINMNGGVVWTTNFPTNLPSNVCCDDISALAQDSKGNIYITGRHYGATTNCDILTLKYDKDGNLVWQNRYEYKGDNCDQGNCLFLKKGFVYVGGHSERNNVPSDYDYVVLKIDTTGGILKGVYRYDDVQSGDDAVSSLYVFDDGKVALTGLTYADSSYDWTTQLLSDVNLAVHDQTYKPGLNIYPNPISNHQYLTIEGKGNIHYVIHSTFGSLVQEGVLNYEGIPRIRIEDIQSGIYFVTLIKQDKTITSKLIIQ